VKAFRCLNSSPQRRISRLHMEFSNSCIHPFVPAFLFHSLCFLQYCGVFENLSLPFFKHAPECVLSVRLSDPVPPDNDQNRVPLYVFSHLPADPSWLPIHRNSRSATPHFLLLLKN